ncbi:putative hydrogenase nickel incorporation protein [Corynebacterium renale]|uniref:Hydrogenase nickel incorporation protein HypB n=1 Tax=Corynebacterium renale TaxID=1724 RepID=A0A2A9DR29_9CORY|nr:hydrogenase nickel incorporation protein HypB [Corynebacterium renale]PFG28432.1 hydrogenase nickel incorporation protein HypB [Corynebacterium renale]SQG64972.1 putative hydrogenase nickel incorporation protein [Corynebacterium renale]SQI26422.1 putative hydrogenase nickel incorporation protein [Corynebacterium renale]STC96920.1 putative hydrogenase nickel incorporation protein [Corynebacterium renale]
MGRFHRHDDGTVHAHHHDHDHAHDHSHEHSHTNPVSEHGDHSKYATGSQRVEVLEDIFTENDACADSNKKLFDDHSVTCVNLMSSPGAGKTTVLRKVLEAAQGVVRMGVVEGDIETSIDADKLEGLGAQIALLNTGDGFGGECHLDAPMVSHALKKLDLDDLDCVIIENVGNLVCPAEFEVGAHRKAMIASVTEGEDKPLKYPVMFRSVNAIVINKIDLLPYVPFDIEQFKENIRKVNPTAEIFEMSAYTGEGVKPFLQWIDARLA